MPDRVARQQRPRAPFSSEKEPSSGAATTRHGTQDTQAGEAHGVGFRLRHGGGKGQAELLLGEGGGMYAVPEQVAEGVALVDTVGNARRTEYAGIGHVGKRMPGGIVDRIAQERGGVEELDVTAGH